jgi:hypothetical protein
VDARALERTGGALARCDAGDGSGGFPSGRSRRRFHENIEGDADGVFAAGEPALVDLAAHVDDQEVEGGDAVADVALADQDLGGVVADPGAMGEAGADEAAETAVDGGVGDGLGAGDGFQRCEDVLVGFDAGDEAGAVGGGAEGLRQSEIGLCVGVSLDADGGKPSAVASPGAARMVSLAMM